MLPRFRAIFKSAEGGFGHVAPWAHRDSIDMVLALGAGRARGP